MNMPLYTYSPSFLIRRSLTQKLREEIKKAIVEEIEDMKQESAP